MENNPAETLNALGEAFGLVAQPPAPKRNTERYENAWYSDEEPQINEFEDATAQRLAELEGRLAMQDRVARRQQVEKQVEDLKGQYGEFDSTELFHHAMRHKIRNLDAA